MDQNSWTAIIGGVALFVAIVIGIQFTLYRAMLRRRRGIAEALSAIGFQVCESRHADDHREAFARLGPASMLEGGVKGAWWSARGELGGRHVTLAEHHAAKRRMGQSDSLHIIAAVECPLAWPRLSISPMPRVVAPLKAALRGRGIELGQRDFDERFRICADSEQFARAFLSPAVREWLRALPVQAEILIDQGTVSVIARLPLNPSTCARVAALPSELMSLASPEAPALEG